LVTNGNVSGKLGFRQGFDRMRQLLRGPEHSAAGVNLQLFRWLDEAAGDERPFFAYLHVVEPHSPYVPAEPWRSRFAPEVAPALGSRDGLREVQLAGGAPSQAVRDDLRALYDAEVAEVDAAFGALRDGLARRGLWERTVVVVLADHGEEFFEHGGWEHGATLHGESIDIPLLVRVPGTGAGRRVETLAQQADVLPTLLALAGAAPPPALDGRSLLPAIAGAKLPAAPALSYQRLGGFVRRGAVTGSEVAVTSGDYRLLVRHEDGGAVSRRLYDRRRDPREQRDAQGELPITTAFLESVLRWPPRSAGSLAQPAGPLDPEVVEQLRALGYVD
jgi:arylsulfatase A-like enzyme